MFWGNASNRQRRAWTFCKDLSDVQPVDAHLTPHRAFLGEVCIKTAGARMEGWLIGDCKKFMPRSLLNLIDTYIYIYIYMYTLQVS